MQKTRNLSGTKVMRPPDTVRNRLNVLLEERSILRRQGADRQIKLARLKSSLDVSGEVRDALEKLGDQLVGSIVGIIEDKLSLALQEILQQDIKLKAERKFDRRAGTATVGFYVERSNGRREDVMNGQGGSVANVLSVGLRLFALTTLNEAEHRRFLILDEQDCWLRPDLVPRLVKIIHQVCKALKFQVLMISHHDMDAFERYADRIYELTPTKDGVRIEERGRKASVGDCDAENM